jgi:hypothetical protein
MSYADIYAAANDPAFQGRCQVAIWKAAQDIANEDPATEGHAARMDWVTRVLQDRPNITPRQLAVQVLRNPVIAGDPEGVDDGAIQYQVNTILADLIAIG